MTSANLLFFPSALFVVLSGCYVDKVHTGPTETDPVSVDLDKSEIVRATLKIGAGKLEVHGGAAQLVDGTITYNVPDWKPKVRYEASSFRGVLTIDQPGKHGGMGHIKNEWDLRLNNDKPIDLSVEFGAGEANLDLGSLNLKGLSVELGAGKIDMDLRGTPKSSYNARIQGGVGEATVHVPTEVGVSAEAHGGIGQIEVEGLRKDGDHWVNDAWPSAKVRVRLNVEGGIGHIHIIGG
jgi:hypothetical protein